MIIHFIKDVIRQITLKTPVGTDLKQSKCSFETVHIAAMCDMKVARVITMDSIIIKYYYHI